MAKCIGISLARFSEVVSEVIATELTGDYFLYFLPAIFSGLLSSLPVDIGNPVDCERANRTIAVSVGKFLAGEVSRHGDVAEPISRHIAMELFYGNHLTELGEQTFGESGNAGHSEFQDYMDTLDWESVIVAIHDSHDSDYDIWSVRHILDNRFGSGYMAKYIRLNG